MSKLYSWGFGLGGALGFNNEDSKSVPTLLVSGYDWKSISAGYQSSLAVKSNGTLWGWGNPERQMLYPPITSSPTQIGTYAKWVKVEAGYYGGFGIKNDGTLWCWGNNYSGQLGDNTTIDRSSPVQTIAGGNNWIDVANKGYTTYAIKSDNTLWAWGENYWGQIGDNSQLSKSSPVQIGIGKSWKSVSSAFLDCFAITNDNKLYGWGAGWTYRLDPQNLAYSSPTQIGLENTWSMVSPTKNQVGSVVGLKADGTIWSWGANSYGECGVNNTDIYSSPVQIGTENSWRFISAGFDSVYAIKSDSTLWAFGRNDVGSLGDDTLLHRSSPVQIGNQTNWLSITAAFNVLGLASEKKPINYCPPATCSSSGLPCLEKKKNACICVNKIFVKNAYVPAITVCNQKLRG